MLQILIEKDPESYRIILSEQSCIQVFQNRMMLSGINESK